MIELVNISLLKKKFATLLSKCFHCGSVGLENISDKITFGDYFDFLEENDTNEFLNKDYEVIYKELFEASFNKEVDDIGPVYWAGLQYMNIFLNYRIPLKTIFLLLPLPEMVDLYDKYHEMNELALCSFFMENYYHVSIFRKLKEHSGLSYERISLLTGINIGSLRYFENNEALFKAPSLTLNAFALCFNVSTIFFKKQSSFLPVGYHLFEDETFIKGVSEIIDDIYLKQTGTRVYVSFISSNVVPALLLGENNVLCVDNKKMVIEDNIIQMIFSRAIDSCLKESISNHSLYY